MNRTDKEQDHASGWSFGAFDSALDANDPDNLELRSLWELSCYHLQSLDFFLLPPGWQVVLDDHPIVLRDMERTVALSNSYFAAKY